jgi:hypothetical protein
MNTPLILNQPGFVLNNARALAAMCQVAYHPETDPTAYVIADNTTDTVCLVWEFDDCIAVVFQGTRDLKQWLADFEVLLVKVSTLAGRVHYGFWRDVDSIWARLLAYLRSLPAKPILLAGHSKGGAEAIPTAKLLKLQGLPVHSVYTFGQPRCFDGIGAADYNLYLGAQTWRVVFQNDIIARVPAFWHSYRHAGQFVLIDAGNRLQLNPTLTSLLVSDALGLFGPWRNSIKIGLAKWQTIYDLVEMAEILGKDHFIQNYVAALHDLQLQ